jgi:phosphatidylserine decarboxylase
MKYADREGKITELNSKQDRLLRKMYTTVIGRMVVYVLVNPGISQMAGKLLDSRISSLAVPYFARINHIDLSQYESKAYKSFNDFFTRKIKDELRPVDSVGQHLISPCDAKLSVFPVSEKAVFNIKRTRYTMMNLLRDRKLAKRFEGGTIFIFRLTVDDYHRYCYIDDGFQSRSRFIQGVLHTVNPVANDVYPIYKENSREYSILKSEHFGRVLMMEVGALLVGKIVNYKNYCMVKRGEEKGRFEYGGSTIILVFEKDKVIPDQDILKNTLAGCETIVKMGEKIGVSKK